MFEDATGKPFHVTTIGETELESEYRAARDPLERTLDALKLEYARGCPAKPRRALDGLFRPATTVEEYIGSVTTGVAAGR